MDWPHPEGGSAEYTMLGIAEIARHRPDEAIMHCIIRTLRYLAGRQTRWRMAIFNCLYSSWSAGEQLCVSEKSRVEGLNVAPWLAGPRDQRPCPKP